MKRLAALARKFGNHVARRLGSSSASGEPLTGPAGRAAPGPRKVPAETPPKSRKVAPVPDSPAPPPGAVPAESRAKRGPSSQDPVPGAVGRAAPGEHKVTFESRVKGTGKVSPISASQEPGSSAASTRLPPSTWKAAEGSFKVKIRSPSESEVSRTKLSAHSTSRAPPPPPQPHLDSDFWFKFIMAGGAAFAFLMDYLKGQVEKEVDLKMTKKDAEEKAKLVREHEKQISYMQQQLKKGRGWFWQ